MGVNVLTLNKYMISINNYYGFHHEYTHLGCPTILLILALLNTEAVHSCISLTSISGSDWFVAGLLWLIQLSPLPEL